MQKLQVRRLNSDLIAVVFSFEFEPWATWITGPVRETFAYVGNVADVLREVSRDAANAALTITWEDAAKIQDKIRMFCHAEKCIYSGKVNIDAQSIVVGGNGFELGFVW
jgi:hypothetical protein